MRRLVLAVLCGLVLVPLPVLAQGTVTFTVCNGGKGPIDVFLSQAGKVSASQVGAADCVAVAKSSGAMQPAYVGLAFADAKGQWGVARHFTTTSRMTPANQSALVRHGNANVTLPMQWLFSPRAPGCVSTGTTVPDAGKIYVGGTFCDQLRYTVNVEAYPETREIAFVVDCDVCDQKANPLLTPRERAIRQSQRAAVDLRDSRVSTASPNEMGILNRNTTVVDVEEVAEILSRRTPVERVNWTVLLPTLRAWRAISADERPRLWEAIPRFIVVRGTVSTVDVNPVTVDGDNNTVPMVNIAFRETPGNEFNVCTTNPDIVRDLFGADFRTSMIGRAIEVEGQAGGGGGPGTCRGMWTSIRIVLARQVRPVQSAEFPAATRVWTPPPPVQDDFDLINIAWDRFQRQLAEQHKQAIAVCQQQYDQSMKASAGAFNGAAGDELTQCRRRILEPGWNKRRAECVEPYERASKENPNNRPALQKAFLACMERP